MGAKKGCAVSFLGTFQDPTGQTPKQPTLNPVLNLLWAGGWSRDLMALSNLNNPVVTIQETILNLGAMLKLKSQVGVLGNDLTFLRSPQHIGNVWGQSPEGTVQPALIGDPYPPLRDVEPQYPIQPSYQYFQVQEFNEFSIPMVPFFFLIDKLLLPFSVCSSDTFNSFHWLKINILENQLR